MTSMLLLHLALVACSSATVVSRGWGRGFVSYPITHEDRSVSTPQRLARRGAADVQLYNVSAVAYLISLNIGTPPQTIKVAVDTGSDELWVNPDCSDTALDSQQVTECIKDGHYVANESSTSKPLRARNDIPYGKGEVEIVYYSDNIALTDGNASMTSVRFGVATDSTELNEGILGLGFGNSKNLHYNNFVDELAAQKITSTKAFSVALGSANANNGGVMIFGGVDTKKYAGRLASLPILPPLAREKGVYRYWVQLDSVGLSTPGSRHTYDGSASPIVLDSGSSLSYLPPSIVKQLAADLQGNYNRTVGLYFVPCERANSSGSVDFTFSGNTFSVPLSDFIWNLDGMQCVLGAATANPATVQGLLGDTFMRSVYVVFDQDSNAIHMAPYVNCGTNEAAIPVGQGAAGSFVGECPAPKQNGGGRMAGGFESAWIAVLLVTGMQLAVALL